MNRCKWCNLKNPLYVKYHDEEYGFVHKDDEYLFEMFILESFQSGLSWECVLNKRSAFRKAYDNFDLSKVINYDEQKIKELLNNKDIIRNKLKINASISNAKIFKNIQEEYGSFYNYLCLFSQGLTIYECDKVSNSLSDSIALDLKRRGVKFFGTITCYSFLQAIGIINSHEKGCFLNKK